MESFCNVCVCIYFYVCVCECMYAIIWVRTTCTLRVCACVCHYLGTYDVHSTCMCVCMPLFGYVRRALYVYVRMYAIIWVCTTCMRVYVCHYLGTYDVYVRMYACLYLILHSDDYNFCPVALALRKF